MGAGVPPVVNLEGILACDMPGSPHRCGEQHVCDGIKGARGQLPLSAQRKQGMPLSPAILLAAQAWQAVPQPLRGQAGEWGYQPMTPEAPSPHGNRLLFFNRLPWTFLFQSETSLLPDLVHFRG